MIWVLIFAIGCLLLPFAHNSRDDGHVHCFCDKKYDFHDDKGQRIIIMACNKCGLENTHVIKGGLTK